MSYQKKVTIGAKPSKIFEAITQQVQEWWGKTDNPVYKMGDSFTTSFNQTYWTFRISTLIPNEKIVWECIDARHIHQGYDNIEKEWVGTTVNWIIQSNAEELSTLIFGHDGLTPDLNCYEICKPAWDRFVTQSLKSFVETGQGMPYLS